MSQPVDLQGLEKESRALFSEDGLLYLFAGLILLLVAASFVWSGLSVLVGLCALLIYPVELLRRRLTYPRIGYARFSVPPGTLRGILLFAVAAVLSLALLAFLDDGRFQRFLPLAINTIFAAAFYFGMSLHGVRRGEWLIIVLAIGSGFAASWFYSDWQNGAAAALGITGLALVVWGLVKLFIFLRKYPPAIPGGQS